MPRELYVMKLTPRTVNGGFGPSEGSKNPEVQRAYLGKGYKTDHGVDMGNAEPKI